jgi:ferredoxin-thioredoxin reductase catalytic chain
MEELIEDLKKLILEQAKEYAEKSGLKLNQDEKIVERIIEILARNEIKYGFRYCPCRRVSGNLEEDRLKICPCFWHKEEIEKDGRCHCGLFVKP